MNKSSARGLGSGRKHKLKNSGKKKIIGNKSSRFSSPSFEISED